MIYLQLFYIFFKVGIFGFGGGYAILPMIYQEVQTFGILTAADFSNLVALSQVTPGPIAINAATYVGFRSAGLIGSVIATTAVALPSLLLIMIALAFINHFRNNVCVQSVLKGIKPATVGLMASAFGFMAMTALVVDTEAGMLDIIAHPVDNIDFIALAIFVVIFLLIKLTRLGAITLTIVGGALGVVLTYLLR